jgi:hypothetical protein
MRSLLVVLIVLRVMANVVDSTATVYLSNLENRFDGGIGDVEGVPNDWRPMVGRFSAGTGTFLLNSVTLEFYADTRHGPSSYWTNAAVRLYQQRGNDSLLLGLLKNPTPNPLPTQWPRPSGMFPYNYTTYVDFHPSKPITLHNFFTYSLEVADPPISSNGLALICSFSSNYTRVGEWRMGATTRPVDAATVFLKLAVDVDPAPGSSAFIVPAGITALRHGLTPGELEIHVIQDPATGDDTCMSFQPQGRDTFGFSYCLDEGVRAFLVSSNAPLSEQTILQGNYPRLQQNQAFEPGIPFYVGFYTGRGFGSTYTNAVFGWGKFVTSDDVVELLDSALEYGGAGIYAGTQTIIPSQETAALNFVSSGKKLRLWWPVASGDFVLQQSYDLASSIWTDVSSPPMVADANFYYETNLQESERCLFYRLKSK